MEMLLGLAVMSAVPVYPLLQIAALRALRGGWWYIAAAPLAIMIPIVGVTAAALVRRSKLWPLLLILGSALASFYLAVTIALHRLLRR